MGFLDDAKDKAADLAQGHEDQISDAIDKGGDVVDDKTGGKFSDQVDKGQDLLKDQLGQ